MKTKEGQVGDHTLSGYAVVWCRDFRLQAVKRRSGRGVPAALVDDTQRQSIVLCCNALAARSGVEPGIPTVQALARCPLLQVDRPSPAAELAAARMLLETALGWVPGIEETGPGILTLDLATQPSAQWHESASCLHDRLTGLGLEVVIGLGETPALARLAAQAALHGGVEVWHLRREERLGKLDQLPLIVAETGSGLNEKLRLWGLQTLGAFARLRREEVAARLGDEGVELWLRLTGRIRRPLRLAKLEQLFEAHHDFDYEVREREPLLFVVQRFLEQLIGRVAQTGRAATAVHFLLTFADGSCHAKRLALPEPTLDPELLFRLVSGHLDAFEMKAAVVALRLRFEPSDPIASQKTLFGAGLKNRHHYEETLKRLRKIVGSDRIGSPRPVDSHRPGLFEKAPLPAELSNSHRSGQASHRDRGRPARPILPAKFSQGAGPPVTGPSFRRYPLGFRTSVQLRDGIPLRVESSRVSGVVIAWAGPWKSGGDWWHQGQQWERSEWDVELLNHGVFRLVESGREWLLEGYYD
jgi:protein ImuB